MTTEITAHFKHDTKITITTFSNFKVLELNNVGNQVKVFFNNDDQIGRLIHGLLNLKMTRYPVDNDNAVTRVIE